MKTVTGSFMYDEASLLTPGGQVALEVKNIFIIKQTIY